ncbi:MAG: class I SAM-dependent methyltransferase, partial [Planctomycetota bacterium]
PSKPAHIYAPVPASVSRLIFVREFSVLYANDFTACWLAKLLLTMGPRGEIWVEMASQKSNEARNQVTPYYLRQKLPGGVVERHGGGDAPLWMRITGTENLSSDIERLRTMYAPLHNAYEEFRNVYGKAHAQEDPESADATEGRCLRTYIYSLFGANQKSFVIEKMLEEHVDGADLRGLDMGGGYGFMACELAAKGHAMEMADHSAAQVEDIGRWLVRKCGLEDRMRLRVEKIENIGTLPGPYDFISFAGCLLSIDRKEVPQVLQSAMRLLRPGGILILHENPREAGVPGSLQYEERFRADELHAYLLDNAGEPLCYSMFTGKRVAFEETKNKLIMATVRKEA